MSRLGKYVCIIYICIAIVLGGLAGYYKFVLSEAASNSVDQKDKNKSSNGENNVSKDTANSNLNGSSNSQTNDNSKNNSNVEPSNGSNDNEKDDLKKKEEEDLQKKQEELKKEQEKAASIAVVTKKHGQVVKVESNLCIRKEPNLKSPADDYLYNGMTFDILEKNNQWYKIKYNEAVGYVKEDYVEEYDEKPPNQTYDEIHSKMVGNSSIMPIPIKVELTAYCNCAICSEAWGSETAMQTHTRVGVVAGPNEIPLGSSIYIPELKNYKKDGIFKVEDRGGAVVVKNDGTYIIDVWLPTHDQVKEFGRKKTLVFLSK